MKYLLDTSVFLWGVAAEERLNVMAQEVLTAASSELYLSVAGTWEIAIKFALGSLPLPKAPSEYIPYAQRLWSIQTLNITQEHALRAGELPAHHRDQIGRASCRERVKIAEDD